MAIQYSFKNMQSNACQSHCPDKFGCPPDRCPDFTIRRHDTKPEFKILVEDCDGPLDIQGLVVEVNMWAKGKLKKKIEADCEYFALADNIGFEQIMVGDIIILDRVRSPEYMLVIGFDECNNLVRVQRGYRNTTPSKWKKGNSLRIFRVMNAPAQTELIYEDIERPDGLEEDVLTGAFLVYDWSPEDVCLPGCYWLEFKLLKMKSLVLYLPGGYWTGSTHRTNDGTYYTGTIHTDSSIPLSYNAVDDKYLIGTEAWEGEVNLYSGYYYTGSTFDNGSVELDRTDTPVEDDIAFSPITEIEGNFFSSVSTASNSVNSVVKICTSHTDTNCEISFTNPALSAKEFGCILGEDVDWTRRFPLQGEGFLIKIENSPTKEFD